MSDTLWPHELQHIRFLCPSLCPEFAQTHIHWLSDAIQPSNPLSSCSPSAFNLSQHQGLFQSQLFETGGQSIGASASVLPLNTQSWFPLGLTGLISLQSKGLWRVLSNTTLEKIIPLFYMLFSLYSILFFFLMLQ